MPGHPATPGARHEGPSADLDALAAAPDHHEVLLENDQVRVLDTRIAPGEATPVHTHRWPSVLHVLTFSHFVRTDADGNVLLDSRSLPSPPRTAPRSGRRRSGRTRRGTSASASCA